METVSRTLSHLFTSHSLVHYRDSFIEETIRLDNIKFNPSIPPASMTPSRTSAIVADHHHDDSETPTPRPSAVAPSQNLLALVADNTRTTTTAQPSTSMFLSAIRGN